MPSISDCAVYDAATSANKETFLGEGIKSFVRAPTIQVATPPSSPAPTYAPVSAPVYAPVSTPTAAPSPVPSASLINGRPSEWGTTITELPNGTFSSPAPGYFGKNIRYPKANSMLPTQLIKSPDNNNALVFQPDNRLAMWIFRNGTWARKWQSPVAVHPYIILNAEGYFYGPSSDDLPEWGWQAVYQMGNPYRASKAPFSIKVANDATIHMYRGDGVEVQMETPFPTTAWVDTPVNCIPGPMSITEADQIIGCQVGGGGVNSPSNFSDYTEFTNGRGECKYSLGTYDGTPRDTSMDRPPKNGGKTCQNVGTTNVGGTWVINSERCIPSACSPNLAQ